MFARPLEAPIYRPVLKHSRFAAKLRAEEIPRPPPGRPPARDQPVI